MDGWCFRGSQRLTSRYHARNAQMIQQSHIEHVNSCCCPRCGSSEISTMSELGDLVSTPSYQFSSDLAEWLSAPQSPNRPVSKRRKVGIRNSVAYGLVSMIVFTVGFFALEGYAPTTPYVLIEVALGLFIGIKSWRTESKLAASEDSLLLETHVERYRSYLHRRRVWSRLRYCFKCAMVVDPATLQTSSLFDVHELANRRITGVSLK